MKILYIVNEDWFFVSHFLGIARAARDAGHQIHVAARVARDGATIRAEGFALHPIAGERGRANPFRALATVMRLRRLIRAERPDLVHTLSTQSTLLGGLAARLAGAPALALSPTGLGHFWTEPGPASWLARQVTRGLLRVVRGAPALVMFFENRDDPPELGFDAADARIVTLGGAGVDPAAFPPQPPPEAPPVRFSVVARMLRSKGVAEAVEAIALARSRGLEVTLDLWGSPDPGNRNTFAEADLQAWSQRDGVRWRGPTSDVASVWRDSHVALLLSHREGLPRSLVEAAASARPIITTDVPGCRAVVDDDVEGLLVPARNVEAAALAIERLARDADLDELYWNVTGNDWPVPIDSAGGTIVFPANAAGNLRAQAFTGAYGSQAQDATVVVNGNAVRFQANEPLNMREGLTADVMISKGILNEPSKLTFAIWFIRSNTIVLLPLWAFIVMFALWWTKGRDPKADTSVAPMYEPPAGFTPAEVGALVDDQVHPRDITATLVDLAVKGFIKIEETESKTFVFSHRDYIFHSLKDPGTWTYVGGSLEAHERVMMNHLFANGATEIKMSDLRNQFYVAIPTIKEDILSELKGKGMYSVDPDSAHAYVFAGILFTAIPFIVAQLLGWGSILDSVGLLIVSALISLIIVFIFARIMTAKSLKGVRTKVEILGLQEFITRVDADRLKRMPPDTFEKILPYAMALGIENRWAKAFQGIVQNPPTWYVGPTPGLGFNPIFFAGSMHAMASDAHQAFVAAPRASSSGSGFGGGGGGGGFSGGGFGGGGGGAF